METSRNLVDPYYNPQVCLKRLPEALLEGVIVKTTKLSDLVAEQEEYVDSLSVSKNDTDKSKYRTGKY